MGSFQEAAATDDQKLRDQVRSRQEDRDRRRSEVTRRYDFGVIRTLRQQLGHTIEKFAELCGVSYAPISRIESNLIKPNLDTLDRIAEGLGISTHGLLMMAERRDATVQTLRAHQLGTSKLETLELQGLQVHGLTMQEGTTFSSGDLNARGEVTILLEAGSAIIQLSENAYELSSGKALTFDTDTMDTMRALTPLKAHVLIRSRI
jgi:transcriptional regulator with XRE-family HTH domain